MLYIGPLQDTARHAHHAAQVLWVPEQGVELQVGALPRERYSLAVIPADVPHTHGSAPWAAMLWVDAAYAAHLQPVRQAQPSGTQPKHTAGPALPRQPTPQQAATLARALHAHLHSASAAQQPTLQARHPAAQRMCALLNEVAEASSAQAPQLERLAHRAGLSPRQMRSVFARDTGLSPQAYLRWRRLRVAVQQITQGASLTAAAVTAGFADGAHFCRVFRAQFGMPPKQALLSLHLDRG